MAKRFSIIEQPTDIKKWAFLNSLEGVESPQDMLGKLIGIGDTLLVSGHGSNLDFYKVSRFNYLIENKERRFTSVSVSLIQTGAQKNRRKKKTVVHPKFTLLVTDNPLSEDVAKFLKS